jgi:hypothetical protein
MIRAIILSATIAALVTLWKDQPATPIKDQQVPYCVIDEKIAMKNPLTGEILVGWGKGYGPCSLQDIYREI